MQRCPNCRARDPARSAEDRQCRRCGMDLSTLIAVEAASERLIRAAVGELASGDTQAARAKLERARALSDDPLVERLIGFTGVGGDRRSDRGLHRSCIPGNYSAHRG